MKEIGWHYTTWEEWQTIKRQGLIPYRIKNREVTRHFTEPVYAIWLWHYWQTDEQELGTLLNQLHNKQSTRLVKLLCSFDDKNDLTKAGRPLQVTHDGHLGDWRYHDSYDPSTTSHLVTKPIEPSELVLTKTFDLLDAVKGRSAVPA